MTTTALVLAATGTTGSATVRSLLDAGAIVRAATRDPSKAPAGAIPTRFDWDDRSTWEPALAGADVLYLVNPAYRADEVELAQAFVDAARTAGVRKVVKLSAMGVEHAPDSTHRRVEQYIEQSGLQWIHLRPSFFMDNFVTFYGGPIRTEGAIYLPAGKGRTPFIASDDIGAAAAEALLGDASGQAWTLTGDELLDHDQVAATLTEALGRPIQFVDVPSEGFVEGALHAGMPELAVEVLVGLYGAVKSDVFAHTDPTLEKVIGRSPITFADWSAEHVDAWRA